MIPLSLRLRNFMSYGEDVPPLDFTGFRTACVTGDNGHGKSTLLDAMTWALWGETRAKSLDDVVRLGQSEAEVELVFDLEGDRYRVLRKRSLRTRQSALELQGFDPATQRYRPLSGQSLRDTEAKIVHLLHMNYDTFINSVCVLQGRADEFTTRRPGERKRILAEILALSVYDALEARARARRHELDQEVRTLHQRCTELQQDVERQAALAAAVQTHQEALARLQQDLQPSTPCGNSYRRSSTSNGSTCSWRRPASSSPKSALPGTSLPRENSGRRRTCHPGARAAPICRRTRGLAGVRHDIARAEEQVRTLREREGLTRVALGRSQSQYEHCLQQAVALQRTQHQRDQAVAERTLYGDLTQMFGKNGIPAIMIDNALPELADAANRVLARVTHGAMHLTLETQRDTTTGGVAETLDIKISDELGTRPYEMFSGGEAFQINFALRVALATMLARRAGTRLRTLVLDEGFGTQDTEGLERLVEVIKALQDDFAKIIVTTHLRELKNAFETHIEVKKDPIRGSFYQVL